MSMLAGCSDLFVAPSHGEVAWANSPDGLTHAILSETNGGATTSYGYKIELHPAPHEGKNRFRLAGFTVLLAANVRTA